MKNKNLVYIFSFMLMAIISGCSDNNENKTSKKPEPASTPVIEIVENENVKEIKVKEKDQDEDQDESYYYEYNAKHVYDKDSQPANKDAAVRTVPRTSLDANLHIRSPYENVQISLLVGKLSKEFIVKCSACHNDYANGVIGPSLLGRNSDYIYDKIEAFKSGEKKNVLMKELIEMMSTKDIRKIADEIYKFNQEVEKMRTLK